MNKEAKNFFEKLSGIGHEEGEFESKDVAVSKNDNDAEEDDVLEESDVTGDEEEGQLTVDVYQTPSSFIVESTIAGVGPENIEIATTPESVTIRGKREKVEKVKGDQYLWQECYWGAFSRSVTLPQEIDPDRAQASIKNGVLRVTLPKVNKHKAKKLKVKFE